LPNQKSLYIVESESKEIAPLKEVIQPHLPVRLPCYDLVPLAKHTFESCSLTVSSPSSGALNSADLTGGVYKARERIHRVVLIRDY
jgi:hypothetical protein